MVGVVAYLARVRYCYEVYISDTKSICTRSMVFFKHKYLTIMPTITPSELSFLRQTISQMLYQA